jgi:hypothetical protein
VSKTWILQANPAQYDIDAALGELDRIWWRIPQYPSEVAPGDITVLWRSGADAGIVGIGRVVTEPQLRGDDPLESAFGTSDEGFGETTRALVVVRAVPFVGKDQLRSIPEMSEHQILVAPMGTVFPVDEPAWEALRQHLPPAPKVIEHRDDPLPPAFAWAQRTKGVLPMPGGYNGYLESLSKVCDLIEEERPAPGELAGRLEALLDVKATAARLRESFLRKVGIVSIQGGVCHLGPWSQRWRRTGDNRIVAALLHSRCQFIGELLDAAKEPTTNEELLGVANATYGMSWDTQTQIVNRRGWLQSAGMLALNDDGKVVITPAGVSLVHELTLYDPQLPTSHPTTVGTPPKRPQPPDPPVSLAPTSLNERLTGLIGALQSTATQSGTPEKFELAVRDGFRFLGFSAEHLGGSGKTDVLLDANLGKHQSFRVTIDCKTSASGSVGDQQVDWTTLGEHKAKHDAQFTAIVAPHPSSQRLLERAQNHHVAVFSVEALVGICRQHAKTPLGLVDYRTLFETGGSVDTHTVDERAEEVMRVTLLTIAICDALRERSTAFGRLSARDVYLVLADNAAAEGTTESELQGLLDTLASPLIGVLDGSPEAGYLLTMAPEVAHLRLEVIARQLGHLEV